ncbi:hypothetical protein ACIBU0_42375 [Streptomyces sp. NPDC049627]|uniref:hypothetical protein n=1 Tax=Streptomyces sp. NPDC049627 TaxID=3365595 RepID=UPI00378AA4A4
MVTTVAPPRTRIASLAVRARNIVDSGLCTRTTGIPEWLIRSEQHERLAAAPAPVRRATLARYDDAVVVDLLVLSYLRHGTPYRLWADTPGGFAQDVLRGLDAAAAGRELEFFGPQHLRTAPRPR